MKMWLYPLWVIIDVLVFLASVAMWITAPEYRTVNVSMTVFALCTGLLLCFLRWDEVKVYVKSKYFKHLLYHAMNTFLVLSIIGVLNYLGNKNFREFDLTVEKRNSLTDQSLKVLDLLKSPMQLTIFARREEWKPMLDILKLYQAKNKFIKLDAIDTDVRPDLVKEKGIVENGTVIIDYKGKESRFQIGDELAITNAFLKILTDKKIVLYLTTEHNEISCMTASADGLSELCGKLQNQNYEVRELNLAQSKEVPADATAILVLGPTMGFLDSEAKQLEAFLEKGGSLFLGLAPSFGSDIYANLTRLAVPYGLKLGKDVVLDKASQAQGTEATILIVNAYENQHPITEGFNQRTIYPLSSSVSVIEGNDIATILATSTNFPMSWAETNLKGVTSGEARFDVGKDLKGPVGLMGIGERVGASSDEESRFVLLGSSSFLVNAYQGQSGNSTMFLNSISWMVQDEGIISFNRPGIEEYPVVLSSQHIQMIFVIAILLVPIVFFGAAIFIYRRRRLL